MTPADLAKFEPERRYATLVAAVLEATGTLTDEIVEWHDRITGVLFARARRSPYRFPESQPPKRLIRGQSTPRIYMESRAALGILAQEYYIKI